MTPRAIFIIRLVVIGLYGLAFLFPYNKVKVADKYSKAIKIFLTGVFIGMCVHLCLSVL